MYIYSLCKLYINTLPTYKKNSQYLYCILNNYFKLEGTLSELEVQSIDIHTYRSIMYNLCKLYINALPKYIVS